MSILTVWLHGQVVGELDQLRNARLRLRFTEGALSHLRLRRAPALDLSLPLTDKRVQGDALERFCDNLLPEGSVRAVLEREHSIRPGDGFALLATSDGSAPARSSSPPATSRSETASSRR